MPDVDPAAERDALPGTAGTTTTTTRPAQPSSPAARPMDSIPPLLKPLVKYGVGGGMAAWFIVGLVYLGRDRLRRARNDRERRAARWWLTGLISGLLATLPLLGLVIWLNANRARVPGGEFYALLLLWLAAPAALSVPALLAYWWGRLPPER